MLSRHSSTLVQKKKKKERLFLKELCSCYVAEPSVTGASGRHPPQLSVLSIIVSASARAGKSSWSSRAREGATASCWSACWLHLHRPLQRPAVRKMLLLSAALEPVFLSTSLLPLLCLVFSGFSTKKLSDATILLLLVWTAGGNIFRN